MEQNGIYPARGLGGKRCAVAGSRTNLRCPAMGAHGIAEDGEHQFGLFGGAAVAMKKKLDRVEAGALGCADECYRSAEFLGEQQGIDDTAARVHEVAHVQEDHGWQAE